MSIADKEKYKQRIIDAQVERFLKNFGAICVEGQKWCGKTWTSSYHSSVLPLPEATQLVWAI